MKTITQIKKEVLNESKQPQNFFIKVERKHNKTYTVKMICGLIDDADRFVSLMKNEGYTPLPS
jgi:hypothetical protein